MQNPGMTPEEEHAKRQRGHELAQLTGWQGEGRHAGHPEGTTMPAPAPSPGDPSAVAADLARLHAEFPGYRIWHEITGTRARLVAVRRYHGTSPHTVVTADPAELRAALAASHPPLRPSP
jgi:hypothetical protein